MWEQNTLKELDATGLEGFFQLQITFVRLFYYEATIKFMKSLKLHTASKLWILWICEFSKHKVLKPCQLRLLVILYC